MNGVIGNIHEIDLSGLEIRIELETQPGMVQVVQLESRESKKAGYARIQFPLHLAYALTVHKAQGLMLS